MLQTLFHHRLVSAVKNVSTLVAHKARLALAIIGLSAIVGNAQVAAPLTAVETPHLPAAGPNRPASVPATYVITPNGYFHPSCVREVAQGDILLKDIGAIRHLDGTAEGLPVCRYPRFTVQGEQPTPGMSTISLPQATSQEQPTGNYSTYVEYDTLTTSTSFAGIVGNLTVPPAPSTNHGQTVFFFPGLEQLVNDKTIIQPVLGWNGFSNHTGWSIASWNCCYNGNSLYSTPMNVNVGDTIIGQVYSNCPSGTSTCPTWYINTQDAGHGSTTLSSTSSYGQTFNWAFGAALEVYNIAQCTDYPSNGSITIGSAVYSQAGSPISNPSWSLAVPSGTSPSCNYGGYNYSQGQELVLTY